MNYEKIYQQLIDRAITRTLTGYKEGHHIVPKCMGGDNSKLNVVDLTAREHFIAHKLLCKIYPNNIKLQYALWMLSNCKTSNRTYKISSREYDALRKLIAKQMSLKMKDVPKTEEHRRNNSQSKIGKVKSDETRKKMSNSFKGRQFSAETRNKLRIANTGNIHSDETKRKISNASKLRTHTIESKQKISDSRKGIVFSDAHRKKLSDAKKGKTRKPHSEETKLKIKLSKLGFNQ
tara:strand:+ start:506 stop:1207 length:702 start_codon:yes stop_codon:yes gene_type:complete